MAAADTNGMWGNCLGGSTPLGESDAEPTLLGSMHRASTTEAEPRTDGMWNSTQSLWGQHSVPLQRLPADTRAGRLVPLEPHRVSSSSAWGDPREGQPTEGRWGARTDIWNSSPGGGEFRANSDPWGSSFQPVTRSSELFGSGFGAFSSDTPP